MTNPIRCFSSQLTTKLALFRNEEGTEENWTDQGIRSHPAIYCGKVIAAELGFALLAVAAAVETVVYATLFIPTFCFSPIAHRKITLLLSSSSFTIFWNLGNVLLFNLFYKNVHTHESFARVSIDHGPRGENYKAALKTLIVAWMVLVVLVSKERNLLGGTAILQYVDEPCSRNEDFLFVHEWYLLTTFELDGIDPRVLRMRNAGLRTDANIRDGGEFYKNYLLAEGKLAPETKKLVEEIDSTIVHFVATRAVYLYACGELKDRPIPGFLKEATQLGIQKIRLENIALDLAPYMHDHQLEPTDDAEKALLKNVREVAANELQDSLFTMSCWEKGLSN